MPNLACRFGCGVTLVEFNGLNEASKSVLKNALLSMGQLVEIPEKEFNFATSVSGCGPAFFQLFYKYILRIYKVYSYRYLSRTIRRRTMQ